MATKHRLRITFDDNTGTLDVQHVTTVDVAGHAVTWSESVEMADPAGAVNALRALVDSNRKEMESRAQESAIQHIAAAEGTRRRGVKRIALGGTVGSMGEVKP